MKRRIVLYLLLLTVGLSATVLIADNSSTLQKITDANLVEDAARDFGHLLNCDFEGRELEDWSLIEVGGAIGQMSREATGKTGETNSHSLRLTVVNPGQCCGVCVRGNAGMSVTAGSWYDLTFLARTEKRENDRGYGLTVSLESTEDGKLLARTTLPEVGGDWNRYTVALHAYSSGLKARLVITMSEPGHIWFDEVSLAVRATKSNQPR